VVRLNIGRLTPHDEIVHELTISSPQNPRVKEALRLRERRHREATGQTLIDGARELLRALDAGVAIDGAFVCAEQCTSEECRRALDRLAGAAGRISPVTSAVFEKLAFGERADGILAIARPPRRKISDFVLPPDPLIAVVEGDEKPGNLRAVLRSADAAGVSAVIAADSRTNLYNPNTIRASLGTVFTVSVVEASTNATKAWLEERGIRVVAARVDADRLYTGVDLIGPLAIVLGSETAGLTPAWSGPDVLAVRIPMLGAADSLNVSASAAILFYEALSQRTLSQHSIG